MVGMTPEDLAAIRAMDAADAVEWEGQTWPDVYADRRALLAEVDRLANALADEGYKDGIRLAEAVNEVVAHERGSIEEAWRYGDAQRDIVMKQQRELLTALAEVDRLRALCLMGIRAGSAAARRDIRARVEWLRVSPRDKPGDNDWQRGFRQSRNETVAAVLAAIDGDATGWTEPPMTERDKADARRDFIDKFGPSAVRVAGDDSDGPCGNPDCCGY